MKRGKLFSRIVATVLTATLALGGAVLSPEFAQRAEAAQIKNCTIPVVSRAEDAKSKAAVFTHSIKISSKEEGLSKDARAYFKFKLKQDSWVHFDGCYSLSNNDGAGSTVKIFGDPSFSNEVLSYGWGYFQTTKEDGNYLKKGTYYGCVYTSHQNYDYFEGNVNVTGFAIPMSKVFKINQKQKKGKTFVTINDTLGVHAKSVQYINKGVGKASLNKASVWKTVKSYGVYDGDKKTKIMHANSKGQYTFTAKKSGRYTLMIEDNFGHRYQKIFNVKVKK